MQPCMYAKCFAHIPTRMCRLQGARDMAATASWYQCEMSVSSNVSDELRVAAVAVGSSTQYSTA
jgi:hypothetical protein